MSIVTTSATESNKMLARQFLHLINKSDLEGICRIIASDWQMHIGLHKLAIPEGVEGMNALFGSFGNIQQHWEVNLVIAEDDKVAVRATNTCAQENFLGIPSYGKPQVFTATFIFEIENGKVKKTYRNADDLGRLLQLEAVITPKQE